MTQTNTDGASRAWWQRLSEISLQERIPVKPKGGSGGRPMISWQAKAKLNAEYQQDKKWLRESPAYQSIHR